MAVDQLTSIVHLKDSKEAVEAWIAAQPAHLSWRYRRVRYVTWEEMEKEEF